MTTSVAFDFETTGLQPWHGDRAFSFIIYNEDDTYEIDDPESRPGKERLRSFCQNTSLQKTCHHLKFELSFLDRHGIDINVLDLERWDCTLLMSQYLDNDQERHGLDIVANRYADYNSYIDDEYAAGKVPFDSTLDSEVSKMAKAYGGYDAVPKRYMREYQRRDGERALLLSQLFKPKLQANSSMWDRYRKEVELQRVTLSMEKRGIKLYPDECSKLSQWMRAELNELDDMIMQKHGEYYNLSSASDVSDLLFRRLQLPVLKLSKKSGKPVTDKDVIQEYRTQGYDNEELNWILKHRSYVKGIAMVTGYLEVADSDGIVHPNIATTRAATGRQASSNPNLQNVSNETSVRNLYPVPARKCFGARLDHFLAPVDYRGIEMRIAVQATGSGRLIELLTHDFDFHDACAKTFYGSRYIDETDKKLKKALRSSAKNARFAMLYGAGIGTVAATLGMSIKDTAIGYARDKEVFPEFYTLMNECTDIAEQTGYISTFAGRNLRVNPEKAFAATDYRIQGSAAEVLKDAEIAIWKWIINQGFTVDDLSILLVVHDEIVFEVHRRWLKDWYEISHQIRDLMIHSHPYITVPLEVEWSFSTTTWANKVEYRPITKRRG